MMNIETFKPDNLIAKLYPRAMTFGIKMKALEEETEIKRGTLLCANADGSYSVYAGGVASEKFSGDALEDEFTLTGKPEKIISVTVGGTAAAIQDYNAFTGVLTLAAAPAAGTDNVIVTYAVPEGGIPSAILADDVTVGTSGNETAVAYRSGNFNPDALILPEGYELTDADKDALRKYDIIFTQML